MQWRIVLQQIPEQTVYQTEATSVKVGITNKPNTRAYQHERIDPDWELMVVLWKTTSPRMIRRAESVIIDYLGEHLENLVGGGGGRQAEVGPYFLYVLLSERLLED